jgi:uncharacterized membrane protein YhiD involved in acid resistance
LGGGLYLEGVITAAITIIALVLLRKAEKKIKITAVEDNYYLDTNY